MIIVKFEWFVERKKHREGFRKFEVRRNFVFDELSTDLQKNCVIV